VAKVYVSAVIPAAAEAVWAVVRDFNALPDWTPFVADSRIEGGGPSDRVGCVRNFHLKDGGLIRERLLALSDAPMSCTYSILESPMGVTDYVATLSLTPVTATGQTFAEWKASFGAESPARERELEDSIGNGVFAAAFAALAARFGS
jgi:hypothetical protein